MTLLRPYDRNSRTRVMLRLIAAIKKVCTYMGCKHTAPILSKASSSVTRTPL